MRRQLSLTFTFFLTLVPAIALAQISTDMLRPTTHGTWTFVFENDTFGGSDDSYTDGVRLSYAAPTDSGTPLRRLLRRRFHDLLCNAESTTTCYSTTESFAVAQTMYTPRNLAIPTVQFDDRPYGGWLYGGMTGRFATSDAQHTIELDAGVIGPHSYAEQAQKWVHTKIVTSATYPRGWSHQLRGQVGLNARYEYQKAVKLWEGSVGTHADLVPHLGLNVGNVIDYVNGGATVRIGTSLDEFPASTIAPTAAAAPPSVALYVFWRHDGRYTPFNLFIRGNSAETHHHLDMNRFVSDDDVGVVFRWLRFRFGYTFVTRSPEIKRGDHRFGSLSLGVAL